MLTFSRLFHGLLLAAISLGTAQSNELLQQIPDSALGFVHVRNLSVASGKVEALLKSFGSSTPNPLTLAKVITGLDAGIDTTGDLAIAMLPTRVTPTDTEPLVLIPINNYEIFAQSIQADRSGAICRVTLLGEDILVAKADQYAMIMNVDNQSTMEGLLTARKQPNSPLLPLETWVSEQDISFVVLPLGMRQLQQWKPEPTQQFIIDQSYSRSQSTISQLLSLLAETGAREWLTSNANVAAVGIRVDEDSNVRLSKQLLLKHTSEFAKLAPKSPSPSPAHLGLSTQPCVLVAGGPLPPGWGRKIAEFLLRSEKSQAAESGLENVSEETWAKEGRAFQLLFADVSSCSFVMLPGKKGEPLLGNFLGIATVPDVKSYCNSLAQVVETWKEMTEQSTSDIKPDFELVSNQDGTRQSCEIVIDVASSARDPNVPAFNWMLESAFGPEGKLRVKFLQIDENRFLFGLTTDQQLAQTLSIVEAGESASPKSPAMQTTLKLTDASAPWKVLVQPQGCLTWASRVANEFLGIAIINEGKMNFPPMSNSPPLGVAIDCGSRLLQFEIVCPADTWATLGKYLVAFSRQ